MDKKYDVLVVGAGPAGSTLGYLLAKEGLKALIIEKEEFPRQKLCGGLITWKTRKLLEKIFKKRFEDLFSIENVSGDFSVYERLKRIVHQVSPEQFYFVDRKKYDMELVNLALSKGCNFLFNDQVIKIDTQYNIISTKSNNKYKADVIIGADGVNSFIRKIIYSEKLFRHNLALAFQAEIPKELLSKNFEGISTRLFFGIVNHGYCWIFPHRYIFAVGTGALIRKNENIKAKFIHFLNKVVHGISYKDINIKSHLVPYGNFVKNPGLNKVLLVGDSAGLVDPFIGEGIYYAHKSAELAFISILEYFSSCKKDSILLSYKRHLAPIYEELIISHRFSKLAFSNLRYLAYFFIRDEKIYYKFAKVIHGIKSYKRIPFLSKLT